MEGFERARSFRPRSDSRRCSSWWPSEIHVQGAQQGDQELQPNRAFRSRRFRKCGILPDSGAMVAVKGSRSTRQLGWCFLIREGRIYREERFALRFLASPEHKEVVIDCIETRKIGVGARSVAILIFARDKGLDKGDITTDALEATSSHKKTVAVIMMGGPTKASFD